MAVFRVERTGDYTVMSNFHLKDKRLSLKAKGLLSQMLSLPDDWDYTLSGLSYINRESKDAIRSAVNELETAGYIRRRQTTDVSSYKKRNYYMVDHAEYLIGVFDNQKKLRSGTSQTVNYALHQGKVITLIHPDTMEITAPAP